jgi:hypothetical protein
VFSIIPAEINPGIDKVIKESVDICFNSHSIKNPKFAKDDNELTD